MRAISFYLPQFHPIAENNKWWGKGFTEWTNVVRARPQFRGHIQPRLPTSLGFYDLRLRTILEEQVELARFYGVYGFCYYYYYFDHGKQLLERPLLELLKDKDPEFPFCVCWANENWTRRWDGRESEVLQPQGYAFTIEQFIENIVPILKDYRYIRYNSKLLILVYRPESIPDVLQWTERLRQGIRECMGEDIYLVKVEAFQECNPATIGFDAVVEFPPLSKVNDCSPITENFRKDFYDTFSGKILDYQDYIHLISSRVLPDYKFFRCVMPGWDNTPRRGSSATVFYGENPETFEAWVQSVIGKGNHTDDNELFFINAWNEWAEGAHLEPDNLHGEKNLAALKSATLWGTFRNQNEWTEIEPRDALCSTGNAVHHNKKVIIFGRGQKAKDFLLSIPCHVSVVGVVDTAALDGDPNFAGYQVLGEETLKLLYFDYMIVASSYIEEATSWIRKNKIPLRKVKYYSEDRIGSLNYSRPTVFLYGNDEGLLGRYRKIQAGSFVVGVICDTTELNLVNKINQKTYTYKILFCVSYDAVVLPAEKFNYHKNNLMAVGVTENKIFHIDEF